jgi:sugar/nucleoside kinase (ribokinase family)
MDGGIELAGLLRAIQGRGVATSLDMAHVDVDAPAGQVDWSQLLQRVLPYVDFFLPGIEEVLFMLDRPRYEALCRTADGQPLAVYGGSALLSEIGERLLGLGAAVAGLKLGDQGLYLRTTTDPMRLAQVGVLTLDERWLGRELLAPAFQVSVVGTTGAGDCAIAGFLAAVLRGLGPEAALAAATAAGASNVERPDAISGVPSWEALHHRITGGWTQAALRVALPAWKPIPATGQWRGPHDLAVAVSN